MIVVCSLRHRRFKIYLNNDVFGGASHHVVMSAYTVHLPLALSFLLFELLWILNLCKSIDRLENDTVGHTRVS